VALSWHRQPCTNMFRAQLIGGLVKVACELSHYPSVGVDGAGRVAPRPEIFLHALAWVSHRPPFGPKLYPTEQKHNLPR
jgi:hypothetical protein